MKVAFAGKGGTGKTTIASAMIRLLSEGSRRVLAIDADPNANLARALGFPKNDNVTPIVKMKELIYERMEIKNDPKGAFYKLNPRIDDIPGRFIEKKGLINLIVMGTVEAGGSGCVCPESTFLRELLKHLILNRGEDIVMDMEAGIEHLGRSTAASMDRLLVIVEPTSVGVETAQRVNMLAADLKIPTYFIANKIKEEQDRDFLYKNLKRERVLGIVSYCDRMRGIDKGGSIMDLPPDTGLLKEVNSIKDTLLKTERPDEEKVA